MGMGGSKTRRCASARSQTTESVGMPRTPNAGARFRDPRSSRSVWTAAHSAALPHPDLITPYGHGAISFLTFTLVLILNLPAPFSPQ
jgi:hypothetical protein